MEKEQQKIMIKLGMYEQQMQQIQQQLQAIEQAIVELMNLNFGLDDLKGKKEKEILAPIGRGIFVKTKLLSENLIVDVGGKTFVKKSIAQSKEMIEEQITKLEKARTDLSVNLENLNEEINKVMLREQKKLNK